MELRRSLTSTLIVLSSIILQENYCEKMTHASIQKKKTFNKRSKQKKLSRMNVSLYDNYVVSPGYNLLFQERSTPSSHLWKSNGKPQLSTLDPCGKPLNPENESDCKSETFSKEQYPNCHSFAGKPSRVIVKQVIQNGRQPGIMVEWSQPSTGFTDLWGFQVQLIDLTFNHPNMNTQCKQINSKMRSKFVVHFENLGYGDHYQLRVQSMPPDDDKSTVVRDISIKGECEILQFQKSKLCCQFSSVSSSKKDYEILNKNKAVVTINITWQLTCDKITQFKLKWITDDPDCNGSADVEGDHTYAIKLFESCIEKHNYTGEIYGVISAKEKTKTEQFWFTMPRKTPLPTNLTPTTRPPTNMGIIIAVISVGAILGIILVVILLMLFKYRDPVNVLIIYASCCMPCKKVIYSLWDVLDSTSLFDIHLDMLNEPQLNENPLRWYETHIKEAEKILVMTSRMMLMSDLDSGSDISDYVNIQFQLNLLRGEISNTTDISKFVPVYNTYNGDRHDIPRFLSMCRAYKLPTELDKIMFHLLGINSIHIHSRRPIVQIASDNHPFLTKKNELIKAIDDATRFHLHTSDTQLTQLV